jgi:hypothetical protein
MRRFFLYMRMYPFWVLIITLIAWIGGWYTSGLPPVALVVIIGILISSNKLAKKEMTRLYGKINHATSKKQVLRIFTVILTGFIMAGLAKMMISLIIWTSIWVWCDIETADLLAKDNLLLSKYLDIFVCIPLLVLFFVLYSIFRSQEYE